MRSKIPCFAFVCHLFHKSISQKASKKIQLTWFNQPNISESQNPMQTRPFNINPCRCRSPNLQKERNRSFSSSDVDLPGQWGFFPKKSYKICNQKKLFGDLWRAVFWGKWTLDVDPKIGKNGYMKEKSKVQRPLQKATFFPVSRVKFKVAGSRPN